MTRRTLLQALPAFRAVPKSATITRIVITLIQGRFHKFVLLNSYDTRPGGETYATPPGKNKLTKQVHLECNWEQNGMTLIKIKTQDSAPAPLPGRDGGGLRYLLTD